MISREPLIDDFINEENDSEEDSLLVIKTANQYLKDSMGKPIPKMLFSEFWFEGELCILFANTNDGKTILAVQIADSISSGNPLNSFKMEADSQVVLYLDFELTDKQFEYRCSNEYEDHYTFSEKFLRAEINTDFFKIDDFDTDLFNSVEEAIIKYNPKILIVDNLSFLKQDTEKSRDALPLMKVLKQLKKKYDLSILLLAHTPKRDMSKPISLNDLAGSRQIANFADSIFAIGRSSKNIQTRYLKHIKGRSTEIIYDAENIILCEIRKESNFLEFNFLEFGSEFEHLKQRTESEMEELDNKIIQMKKDNKNLKDAEIARILKTNRTRVGRVLKKFPEMENKCNSP
jgi:KaiC/GvpD/RAD55 family RecA-like ATPase